MLEMYDFTVTQTRYVKAAMDQIPSYRPDGLTPAAVAALTPNPDPIRGDYITKKDAAGTARDSRNNGATAVHDVGVDFLAQAGSIYRKNTVVREQLGRILLQDQTFSQCMTRGDQSSAIWGTLPQVGSPPAAFVVLREGLPVTKANLDTMLTTARAADVALPGLDQAFQKAEAELHKHHHDLEDFVTAALVQGRSNYSEGTPEREIIDAIPTAPAQSAPDQAVITLAEITGSGEARVEYDAPRATSYDVFVQRPNDADFVLEAEDRIEKFLNLTNVTTGITRVKVVGRNSRGTGPESDVAELVQG